MLETRVIPCLLLEGEGLVKTERFKDAKYVGDPLNAVRIFNEKEVDELILLDITASAENRSPRMDKIREIAGECFMPLCYGGGIRTLSDIETLFAIGVEKVALNTALFENPSLVSEAAGIYGSQAVVASIDAKRNSSGRYGVYSRRGSHDQKTSPEDFAAKIEGLGAGEILLTSIDRDGTRSGFDLEIIQRVSRRVTIPVVASGGAGKLEDFKEAVVAGAQAVAAGSFFVFQGKHKAVLITYPEIAELEKLFGQKGGELL